MKRIILYFSAFFLCLVFALPGESALAQNFLAARSDQKPEAATPEYIAMIFSKLSGQPPDFHAWALHSEAYKNASKFDQTSVLEQETEKLRSTFSLLAWAEPLTLEMPVRLSSYSAANKGFFIENFSEKTFFPVYHSGQSYAVIADRLMDRQWVPVPEPAVAAEIEAAAAKNPEKMLIMSLTLMPKYADNAGQATLEGEKYWLLAAEIRKVLVYDPESSAVLWRSKDSLGAEDPKLKELLQLRQ